MARQMDGFAENNIWSLARRSAAVLTDSFFRQGIEAVVVEGEFFTEVELNALLENVATPVTSRFITLVASYERALEHVAGDPSRGMSRDPVFLRRLHGQFAAALPFLRTSSLLVEVEGQSPSDLAELIVDTVLG